MERIIPIETLKELLEYRGMVLRQKQLVSFEDAMQAVIEIGSYMVPGFRIDKDNEFAYTNILKWVINDPTMLCNTENGKAPADPCKGIYVYGNVGTGKSMLLDIMKVVCRHFKIKAKFGTEPSPLAWRSFRADDICDLYGQDGDLHPWKAEKVLCIQDLGNEPAELLYMGNRRRVMRSILEARGDAYDNLTLISSNIPLDHAGDIYGPRVQSRLMQMCNAYRMDGKDRRY